MQTIPLSATPSQSLSVVLGGQLTQIRLFQRDSVGALFADISLNSTPIQQGQLCLDRTLLIRSAYLGFVGDLAFLDTQGTSDPVYTGLGSRFLLLYLAPADL